MSSNRPHLILDEQSFQGLLSAAFIVQEYNDRLNRERRNGDGRKNDLLKQTRPTPAPEAIHAEPLSICPHCGAPKDSEESRCESCGRDEFRPGERLQRNWASLWLMSQEKDSWPVRSGEIREDTGKDASPLGGERRPFAPLAHESANSGAVELHRRFEITGQDSVDAMRDSARSISARDKSAPGKSALHETAFDEFAGDHASLDDPAVGSMALHNPTLDRPALDSMAADGRARSRAEAESRSNTKAIDEVTEQGRREGFATEESDLALQTLELSASEDFLPVETSDESTEATTPEMTEGVADASEHGGGSLMQRLADLRVILRFHRADLYLGAAVLVAVLALLWPTASSVRRSSLSPWERALVTLGLAEAPEPATHLQGDPSIEVWVDPHTALYYCPGEELFGKTPDGRLSTQSDAQMDRFEPAGHSACE